MRRVIHRPISLAARAAQGTALFALVLAAISAIGFRLRATDAPTFLFAYGIAGAAAVLALVLVAFAVRALWTDGAKGGMASIRAGMMAGIVLAPLAVAGWLSATLPLQNDLSTDPTDPPQFPIGSRLIERPMFASDVPAADLAASVAEAYPDIVGRRYGLSIRLAEEALVRTASTLRWQALTGSGSVGAPQGKLQAYLARSPVLGFEDDVVVRLLGDEAGVRVDIRSAGHVGGHDLGGQARRIRAFYAEFERQLKLVQAERNSQ